MADNNTTARIKLVLEGASAVEQGLSKVEGRLGSVTGALGALGGSITAAGFATWIKGAIDAADETGKMAQKTGLLAKEVAGLQLAFDQGGAGDKMQATLARLAKEAANDNDAFKKLGITVTDNEGRLKSTRQLLGEVSDKFQTMGGSTEKTALAQEIFGKSGADIIPVLNAGSAALVEYDAKAQALGLTLDEETTKAAEQFNDQMDLVLQRSQGLARQIATDLMPVLTAVSEEFAKGATSGGTFSTMGTATSVVIETLVVAGANLSFVLQTLARDAQAVYNVYANILTLDFDGLKKDVAAYKAETLSARDALDSFESRVLSARKVAASPQGQAEAELRKQAKLAADKAIQDAERQAEAERRKREEEERKRKASAASAASAAAKAIADAEKQARQAAETEAKFRQTVIDKEREWAEEAVKAREKITAEAAKGYEQELQSYAQSAQSAQQRLLDLQQENEAQALATSLQISMAEAVELTAIARLREQQVAVMGNEAAVIAIQQEIDARQSLAGLINSNERAAADRKAQQEMLGFWEEIDGTAKAFTYDLATGGEDAFKRWGEALEREVYNMLWQMTARKWIFQISGMDAGGGGGTDWISMASKAYDWYTGGASGAAAASSYAGYAAAGGSYAAGAVGDAAVVSYGSSAAAGSSAAGGASAMYGYMTYAALIAAAVLVAENLYEKGYNRAAVGVGSGSTTTFGYSSYTSDPNMGASTAYNIGIENFTRGLYDWIGISEKWSDILSGTVRFAHMFGGKLNEVGLEADIAGGSASVSGYAEYDGGLFRSDKTVGIDVDPRDAAALDAQVEAVIAGTKMMARAMGLSEEAINAYTGSLQVNFKGADTAQEQAERLATAMADLQYSLLKAASGGQLAREEFERMTAEALAAAESAGISAQSISDVLVNGMMNRLGGPETGAQMADLIAGGIIQSLAQNYTAQVAQMFMSQIITPVFTAMMAGVPISQAISQASIDGMVAYAQNAAAALNAMLNSEEMRAAIGAIGQAAASVGESFGSIALPSFGTYELAAATAAVDEAAQAAAEAEAERYSIETELLNLLGKTTELRARELAEIDASNQALQLQVWALEDSRTALDSAFDALQRAMDAENERIEEQLQAASDSESTLRDIFDTLGDSISSLQGEVTATTLMQAETARALLRDAINTGLLPEAESLADWIDAATGGLSAVRYTSAVEQDLATLRLSAELQALQDIAEPQLSAAEEAVVVLEAQLEANELLLQTAQEQYEVAVGTYEATVSVVDGINSLHTAMAEYSALIASGNASVIDFLSAPPEAYSGGSSGGGYSGGSSGGSSSSGSWTAEGYWSKNPDLQAEFARANLASSPDFNQDPALSAELEYATWHWNTFGKNEGRKFATGAAFRNGIVSRPTMFDVGLMGEKSPEAIMPLANIGGSLGVRAVGGGDDETKALLRQLLTLLQGGQSEKLLMAIATHTARGTAVLERVSGKGNELAVRTLATTSLSTTEVAP